MLRCAIEVLRPDLAFGVVREVAGAVGLGNAAGLSQVHVLLRSLAPTAARISSGLAVGSALTNLWDSVFDNLADSRITVSLEGSALEPLVLLSQGTSTGQVDSEPARSSDHRWPHPPSRTTR